MDAFEKNLHINDELFENMRDDTDMVMQRLIKNMIEKESFEGKITITIDVALTQEFIPNRDPNIEGETRRVLTPSFSHKVGSVMQIKNEEKGKRNCEGTELVWDEELGEYVLKPITNTSQMTIFDADFRCVNDPENEDRAEHPALEGPVAALPEFAGEDAKDSSDKGPKKCTTGWSRYGTCNCCGNGGVTCCAQCQDSCNSRCGWIDEPYVPEEETDVAPVSEPEDISDELMGDEPPTSYDDDYGYEEPEEDE